MVQAKKRKAEEKGDEDCLFTAFKIKWCTMFLIKRNWSKIFNNYKFVLSEFFENLHISIF